MNIEFIDLKEIKPYPNNPRINDKAVDRVASSINEFGFNSPIVVDKDLMIINGHTRYKASQKMNLEKVPVIVVDNLTDEQIKAYRIADNKTAEYSEWDYEKLIQEIQELSEANYDLELTGFDEDECLKMIEDLSEFDDKVPDDDSRDGAPAGHKQRGRGQLLQLCGVHHIQGRGDTLQRLLPHLLPRHHQRARVAWQGRV